MKEQLTRALGNLSHGNGPILLVLSGALIAFSSSLASSFHFDDQTLFTDSALTSAEGWFEVWQPLRTRPITYLTFWFNYQLGGRDPVGYHIVNLALHLLVIWLLHRTLIPLIGNAAALIAAAIFALHPIQTEPVAYVYARGTLLSTLFCVLSLRSWTQHLYTSSAIFFGLALLCKEECVTFPLFLLLIGGAFLPAAGMLFLSLAAGLRVFIVIRTLQIAGAGLGSQVSTLDYLSTQGTVILHYLRLLIVPYGFSFDPDLSVVSGWRALFSWAAVAVLILVAIKLRRYGRWFIAGLILLAPSTSIFPADDLAADRRLYLPMIALSALAGILLVKLNQRMLTIAMVACLGCLTFAQTRVWITDRSLWTQAVSHAPKKLRPRVLLSRASDLDTALRMLDAAQTIAPKDPAFAVEKGVRLLDAGFPSQALAELDKALILAPENAKALNDRGVALLRLDKTAAAIEDFRHALRVEPCFAAAQENLERLGVHDLTLCTR